MICNTCGVNNKDENKFCVNCGEELVETENTSPNDCSNCGTVNEEANKFCISCGYKLNQKSEPKTNFSQQNRTNIRTGKKGKNKKQHHKESKSSFKRKQTSKFSGMKNLKLLWITVGIVIGAIIVASAFDLIFRPQVKDIPVELKSSNPVIESKVFEIASKFVCSCGTCNEESLEVCSCGRAVEERQFIRDYLEQNQRPDDIVVSVANKYGWLKAEFASNYSVDASKVWNPSQLEITSDNIPITPGLISNKAMISDRYTIYSAFNCPCGQCNKDELRDCTCTHPNGAMVIKKFIDEKINENKYSISEVIKIVEKQYGGKKLN